MRREWTIELTADSNHLTIQGESTVRIGTTWVEENHIPTVDLICDPSEDGKTLLKDALVALIERL